MQIYWDYHGKKKVSSFEKSEVIIGRAGAGVDVDLPFSDDDKASPRHARVWVEGGQYWVEDLNSEHGTLVNGEEIRGKSKHLLRPGHSICIGDATLRVEFPAGAANSYKTKPLDAQPVENIEAATQMLSADVPVFLITETRADETTRRLAFFYELPLQLGAETRLDALLQQIIEQIVGNNESTGIIRGAKRAIVLLRDKKSDKLLMKAHLPAAHPAYSETLVWQAIQRRVAVVWPPAPRLNEDDLSTTIQTPESVYEQNIESAMYAPMVWNDEVLGLICVDSYESSTAFSGEDLRLLQAVSQHAAMAVAHQQLQDELRREAERLANVLRLFSPQVAEWLKNRRGKFRLGGTFRDATILFSDIRGFTRMSECMEPDDVAELLDDYFSQLVPVVLKHRGVIDKFVGDAILAVFGSPEEDADQHMQAIRTALEMQSAMQQVNAWRDAHSKVTTALGIGIHTGPVVHGFIGSKDRMEFTVIGDTVNQASRYCDGAGKGEVLISPEVYQWVFKYVEVEKIMIPTKHEGTLSAYRVKRIKASALSGSK